MPNSPAKKPLTRAQQLAQAKQQNAAMANALKRTAQPNLQPLQSQTVTTGGQTMRFKIKNTGLLTGFYVTLTLNTTIGTAAATLSPMGIYAAISKIRFVDYANIERINAPLFDIWVRNSLRESITGLAGMPSLVSSNSVTQNVQGITAPLSNPATVLAVGTNTQTVTVYIPIAYDYKGGDLRGMLRCDTTEDEAYLNLEVATALYANGNDEYMFNGSGTTTVTMNSLQVDVVQELLLPQPVNGHIPYPMKDLHTIYELIASRSSDNLGAGSQKLINMPNNRDVRGFYFRYHNNAVLGGSAGNGLTRFQQIIGGSNYPIDINTQVMVFKMLERMGTTLPSGVYFFEFPRGITTADFGVYQFGIYPAGTLVTPFVAFTFESFYMVGNHLSALVQ